MIAVTIYCYLIKYRAKRKYLLSFHNTNDKLKKFYINKCIMKMSNKVKDIHIKSCTYYFFNCIINIKNFDPNIVKIDEKSNKNILIHYIEHVPIKDLKYVKINSVNLLYLIFSRVNEYFEEINKSKYSTLVPTN